MSNAFDKLLLGAEKGTIIHVQKLNWRTNVIYFFYFMGVDKYYIYKTKNIISGIFPGYGLIWIKAFRYSMRKVTEGHVGNWAVVC